MLLSHFKTGSNAASTLCGSLSDGFVARTGGKRSEKLQVAVRAAKSGAEGSSGGGSGGWLEVATSRLSRVGSLAGEKLRQGQQLVKDVVADGDQVEYKGTAVTMKKLQVFDLIDRMADIQDDTSELMFGKHVTVQLISTELDPSSGEPMQSSEVILPGWAAMEGMAAQNVIFELKFSVPKTFGIPGAIIVKNNHPNEFLLLSFELELHDKSRHQYYTNSWIYNTEHEASGRIFFHNKPYLPSETPAALKELREREMQEMRGDGTGERKERDRIYDYAIYNDLGNPDENPKLDRPNLGGNAEYPFPRRCRTGRPATKSSENKNKANLYIFSFVPASFAALRATPIYDPNCESRKTKSAFYIPRDECFDKTKMSDFMADGLRSMTHSASSKTSVLLTRKTEFDSVEEIKKLYAPKDKHVGGLNNTLPKKANLSARDQHPLVFLEEVLKPDGQKQDNPLLYPMPKILQTDDKAWRNNDEFAREFLAGLNPVVIRNVKEFPIKSTLDPAEFGDPTSAISEKHIEGQLQGLSVEQAVSGKKIFVVDYHDAFLPFVARINAQENSASYATRALLFLSSDETLKIIAIELVLPPTTPGGEKKSRVLTPPADTSKVDYMWELAKAHVNNNDLTAHQVFSHFTRCHAVTEPVIIASNRQLSKMHPIWQLMAPHFKNTLEINRQARGTLIAAGGSIETHFTTRAYSLAMASVNYRDTWTFESQALPYDLINRGMAVSDSTAPHGVRLVVEDYPYAADGLELWSAIKQWCTEYVDIYYKEDGDVQQDVELQKWWAEIRNEAHADKKDAPGWPAPEGKQSLVDILTILQWIPSCQHAAVNFGQYDYAGFMPHHSTVTRRLLPEEGNTKEWKEWNLSPEKYYLRSLANIDSTTTAMSVYEVLSAHCPNEEYIDERPEHWTANDAAKEAFNRHAERLAKIDELIRAQNADPKLKNRAGAVNMPYELLRPSSESGVTFRGVPNSITI